MMNIQRNLLIGLAIFGVGLPVHNLESQVDYYKLGELAGEYIGALSVVDAVQESQCGYAIGINFQFDREVDTIIDSVDDIHARMGHELGESLKTDEFKDERRFYMQAVETLIQSLIKHDHYNEETACGVVAGQFLMLMGIKKKAWLDYLKTLR